jgi:hypothetical protein
LRLVIRAVVDLRIRGEIAEDCIGISVIGVEGIVGVLVESEVAGEATAGVLL